MFVGIFLLFNSSESISIKFKKTLEIDPKNELQWEQKQNMLYFKIVFST